jgi:hypothetical protein
MVHLGSFAVDGERHAAYPAGDYTDSNVTSGSPSPSLALKRGGVGLGSISSQVLYLPIHFIQH